MKHPTRRDECRVDRRTSSEMADSLIYRLSCDFFRTHGVRTRLPTIISHHRDALIERHHDGGQSE